MGIQLSRVFQKIEKRWNFFLFALNDVKINSKTKIPSDIVLFEAIFTDFWPLFWKKLLQEKILVFQLKIFFVKMLSFKDLLSLEKRANFANCSVWKLWNFISDWIQTRDLARHSRIPYPLDQISLLNFFQNFLAKF